MNIFSVKGASCIHYVSFREGIFGGGENNVTKSYKILETNN